METLRSLVLLAATLATGLVTGAFALYAHTIMPGLRRTDDRTFVGAFTSIDRAIVNPWFVGGCFLGALVFTALAAIAHLGRPALPWIVTALVLYGVAFAVTVAVHLPLNDAIKAAGTSDPAGARQLLDEARWAAWNLVRTVTSVLAFGCLAWSLLLSSPSVPSVTGS